GGDQQGRPRASPGHGRDGTGTQLRAHHHDLPLRSFPDSSRLGPLRRRAPRGQHRDPPAQVQERPARPEGDPDDPGRREPLPLRRDTRPGGGDGHGSRGPQPARRALAEVRRPSVRRERHKEPTGDALDRPRAPDPRGPDLGQHL
ncbi:MAG: Putative oxidoreductase, partial [uncultured Rubrobacteraceae bacterium]